MTNSQPRKDLLADCPHGCGYSTEGTEKQNYYRLRIHEATCPRHADASLEQELQAARADAWDEGATFGAIWAQGHDLHPNVHQSANPYRTADPVQDPEGRALVQNILDRKAGNQEPERCYVPVPRCLEAAQHEPSCRCALPKGHLGSHLSQEGRS